MKPQPVLAFLMVALLTSATVAENGASPREAARKPVRVLLVVAHPDDEWELIRKMDRALTTGRREDRIDSVKDWSSITDDPADADRLRGDIQRQLIGLVSAAAEAPPDIRRGGGPLP